MTKSNRSYVLSLPRVLAHLTLLALLAAGTSAGADPSTGTGTGLKSGATTTIQTAQPAGN